MKAQDSAPKEKAVTPQRALLNKITTLKADIKSAKTYPDAITSTMTLADAYARLGQHAKAVKAVERADAIVQKAQKTKDRPNQSKTIKYKRSHDKALVEFFEQARKTSGRSAVAAGAQLTQHLLFTDAIRASMNAVEQRTAEEAIKTEKMGDNKSPLASKHSAAAKAQEPETPSLLDDDETPVSSVSAPATKRRQPKSSDSRLSMSGIE